VGKGELECVGGVLVSEISAVGWKGAWWLLGGNRDVRGGALERGDTALRMSIWG
jgi:hypothetical protein